jgi:hypothetical protein
LLTLSATAACARRAARARGQGQRRVGTSVVAGGKTSVRKKGQRAGVAHVAAAELSAHARARCRTSNTFAGGSVAGGGGGAGGAGGAGTA